VANLFVRRSKSVVWLPFVLDYRLTVSYRRRLLFAELRRLGDRTPLPLLAGRVSVMCLRGGGLRGAEDEEEVAVTRCEGDRRHLDIHGHRAAVDIEPNIGPGHGGIAATRIANQVG